MIMAVIFAGGTGARMENGSLPKQFLDLNGKPIIIHTLEHFEEHENIDEIVVVCLESWISYLQDLLIKHNIHKVKCVTPGGETGQVSIYNGLCKVYEKSDNPRKDIVLIHDGVRPFINKETITANINSVLKYGSAVTVAAAIETVICVNENEIVENVVERDRCRMAKAPQSFFVSDVYTHHKKALSDGLTNVIDTATLMSHYGFKLHTVRGPWDNIKITTPSDFYISKALIESKETKIKKNTNESSD